jgi:hypothetical protein
MAPVAIRLPVSRIVSNWLLACRKALRLFGLRQIVAKHARKCPQLALGLALAALAGFRHTNRPTFVYGTATADDKLSQ